MREGKDASACLALDLLLSATNERGARKKNAAGFRGGPWNLRRGVGVERRESADQTHKDNKRRVVTEERRKKGSFLRRYVVCSVRRLGFPLS